MREASGEGDRESFASLTSGGGKESGGTPAAEASSASSRVFSGRKAKAAGENKDGHEATERDSSPAPSLRLPAISRVGFGGEGFVRHLSPLPTFS